MRHPGVPERAARHVPRPRVRPDHRPPALARRDGGRAAAGAPLRRDRRARCEHGLTNYWGYNSIGFFAPDVALRDAAARAAGDEFKSMVKTLHARRHRGDPRRRLQPHRRGQPPRPDAVAARHRQRGLLPARPGRPALLRRLHGHGQQPQHAAPAHDPADHRQPALLGAARCTSTASASTSRRCSRASCTRSTGSAPSSTSSSRTRCCRQVKLIAEPWDVGPGGYQVGNFPVGWAEWNGEYRDAIRRFWRGDAGQLPELASRLSGSSDLYAASGRRTYASINFVTAHDGYTLNDLVSLRAEAQRGERRGQPRRPQRQHLSRNWGVEGPTRQPAHPPPRASG